MNGKGSILLIHSGRLVDPGRGIDQIGDMIIAGRDIMHMGTGIADGPSAVLSEAQRLDASGLVVCPGFVDLHCHLREPGLGHKETIATGTEAAARGGFTTVCCMGNTDPPLDSPAVVEWLQQKALTHGRVTVLPIGCITVARRGTELADMPGLARAGVIAFSDDGDPVEASHLMRDAMNESLSLGLPIIDHCEDKSLSRRGVVNEGRVSAQTGLTGIPAAAEEIMIDRDLKLAKLTGASIHIAHVSTRGSLDLIRRAKEDGIPVSAEVTPHHLTLTEERVLGGSANELPDTSAKVNPPLRTRADVEALIDGLKEGVIDAIATDHAPHAANDKDCSFELAAPGISGFETTLGCLMSLVHSGRMSLALLISRLTFEPARIIGRHGELGTLKAGIPANITVFDPDREWTVDSRRFASRGKNTPYDGYRFRGKVMATIANGKVAYLDDALRPSRLSQLESA